MPTSQIRVRLARFFGPAAERRGQPLLRARVSDVSQGGARLETPGKLPVGAHVVVSIEGLAPQPAVVRWNEDGVYGLTFNRIIALPELVHWLQTEEPPALAFAG